MTLYYADVSSFQAGLDLRGLHAVCVKATEGTGYINPDYGRAKANAAAHGCYFTAYHFLLAGAAAPQAAHAHAVVGAVPLMLDVEAEGTSRPGKIDAAAFITAYRKLGGVCHLMYLPHWYWQQIGSPPLAGLGVALVSSAYTLYTDHSNGIGWQPYGGLTPSVWQYTDALGFNGQNVDFNAFRGTHGGDQSAAAVAATVAQYKSLCSTGKVDPVPAVHPPVPPAKRSASGKESLRHALAREGTSLARGLYLMAADPNSATHGGYGPLQSPYLAAGNYDALMPAQMTYWVG